VDDLPLPALLSRVLVAFAVEFERESATSLAISANVLRVLGDDWALVRDLPSLGGVSKEAVSMATGFLVRNGRAEIGPVPAPGRGQRIRLTPSGRRARDRYGPLTAAIEDRWRTRWGDALIGDLRARLERLTGAAAVGPAGAGAPDTSHTPGAHGEPSLLLQGVEPYPDGWRAQVRRPPLLPHYPIVLHRGGYPDGS
jgi:DNA-binding MarR family transcriptional regulator